MSRPPQQTKGKDPAPPPCSIPSPPTPEIWLTETEEDPRGELIETDTGPQRATRTWTAHYRLELWPTSECLEWEERLTELGLVAVAMVLSERQLAWRHLQEADFPVLARQVLDSIKKAELAKFMRRLLGNVYRIEEVDGREVPVRIAASATYDQVYKARTMHLYKLCGWVIAENLADFTIAFRFVRQALRSRFKSDSTPEGEQQPKAEGEDEPEAPAAAES